MSQRTVALLTATLVAVIYGVTFTIAKDVMPAYVQAFGFIFLRVGGSAVLFWIAWLFAPKEKIERQDWLRIAASALFGVALNMLTFFKGLSLTSPISAAVLMVTTPMIVLVLSALLLDEKMRARKAFGILLGLAGTVFLILYGKPQANAPQAGWGNLLVFINAVSYGLYLILVKKLMHKYNAFTFVKWIYTFGFLMVLPFGWHDFMAVNWTTMPDAVLLKIGFVVAISTFLTYLLNLFSMKQLSPSTVAVFIYLQPLFASIFAIGLGKDTLTPVKLIAALLIFAGVFLVTQKPAQKA